MKDKFKIELEGIVIPKTVQVSPVHPHLSAIVYSVGGEVINWKLDELKGRKVRIIIEELEK